MDLIFELTDHRLFEHMSDQMIIDFVPSHHCDSKLTTILKEFDSIATQNTKPNKFFNVLQFLWFVKQIYIPKHIQFDRDQMNCFQNIHLKH